LTSQVDEHRVLIRQRIVNSFEHCLVWKEKHFLLRTAFPSTCGLMEIIKVAPAYSLLPSEPELVKEYGVSRGTVKQA